MSKFQGHRSTLQAVGVAQCMNNRLEIGIEVSCDQYWTWSFELNLTYQTRAIHGLSGFYSLDL
jgi:hypothetical protein